MRVWTTLVASFAIGCSAINGPGAVENRRDRWRARAPQHYQVDQDVLCFCPPPRFVRIEVRHNAIVAMTDRETDAAIPTSQWDWFYTVEGLFDLIADARPHSPARLDVTYHPTDHYPTSISIDYKAGTADDELTVTAWVLTSLP